MRILNTKAGFTDEVFPGRFTFILEMNKYGINLAEEQIAEQAIHFPRIVIKGDEPFEQKEAVAKFIKKVRAHNLKVEIDIFTNGEYKPIQIGNIENINYIVKMNNEKVDMKSLLWFSQMSAHFIFYIKTEDDIDRMVLLIKEHSLDKSKIYLTPDLDDIELRNMVFKKARFIGCNVNFQDLDVRGYN